MSSQALYIRQPSDSIERIARELSGNDDSKFETCLKNLDAYNSMYKPHPCDPLVIGNTPNALSQINQASWRSASLQDRQKVIDFTKSHDIAVLTALAEMAETLKGHYSDPYTSFGDLNTFGGGGLLAVARQGGLLASEIQNVERLLSEYARAKNSGPGVTKASLKPRIRQAYKQLNEKFGKNLELIANRHRTSRLSVLESPKAGMTRAVQMSKAGKKILPLTNNRTVASTMSLVKGAARLSPAVRTFDIMLRARNVQQSDRRFREAMIEVSGFGVSTGVGLGGLYLGLFLVTGPFGIVVGLGLAGAGAVLGDYLGKEIVGSLWK